MPPIHYTATFSADSAEAFADMANTPRHPNFYTRYGNPVHKRVEAILASLEGTETAMLMASGMGAISTTVLALVSVAFAIAILGVASRNRRRARDKTATPS